MINNNDEYNKPSITHHIHAISHNIGKANFLMGVISFYALHFLLCKKPPQPPPGGASWTIAIFRKERENQSAVSGYV